MMQMDAPSHGEKLRSAHAPRRSAMVLVVFLAGAATGAFAYRYANSFGRPHVEPVSFRKGDDGSIFVEVIQTVRDLEGKFLQDQAHGLKDKTVGHIFRFKDGRVSRFDVQDIP